jgi:multidrug efflux system outer membrane protein
MQLKSLVEQASASRHAAELAEIRYREGAADFLVLLDAQRTQLDAEDAVAQVETEVNVSVVAIYKALGGVGQRVDDGSGAAAGGRVAQAR